MLICENGRIVDHMALLISRRMRRPALIAGMVAWGIAVVLGAAVAGQRHAGTIDRTIIHRVHATVGDGHGLAAVLLAPTDTVVIGAAALALIVAALVLRRWDIAVLAVVTPTICVGMVDLAFKPLFGRRLHGLLSYPSGHAVAAVAVYTVAVLTLISIVRPPWRHVAVVGWGLLTVVIMVGLIGMNWHYPTDTVGGVCVAVGVVLPCALGTDAYLSYRRPAVNIPAPRSGHTQARLPRVASDVRRSSRPRWTHAR
jgi:undecaprenyl-diphosphatase